MMGFVHAQFFHDPLRALCAACVLNLGGLVRASRLRERLAGVLELRRYFQPWIDVSQEKENHHKALFVARLVRV